MGSKHIKLPTYFFLNGKLHRKLHTNRGRDRLVAWSYPDGIIKQYSLTDSLGLYERAFDTAEVCTFINRKRLAVEKAIIEGHIEMPQFTYGIDENRKKYAYKWREEDILKAHEFFASRGRGRPRKDGLVKNTNDLPTPRELRAMIHGEEVLYVKDEDGQFVPTFRARNWN